jgi:hypothetical protein
VLTLNCIRAPSPTWIATRVGAAVTLSVITWNVVYADGIAVGGCVGGGGSINCVVRWGEAGDPYVRIVPKPIDADEQARAAQRDRKWAERCRPVITQDQYGVPRYHYAAVGCEFDIIDSR